jgi:hypothetical protein
MVKRREAGTIEVRDWKSAGQKKCRISELGGKRTG